MGLGDRDPDRLRGLGRGEYQVELFRDRPHQPGSRSPREAASGVGGVMDSNASACLRSSTIATPDHDPDTARPGIDPRDLETRPLTVGEVDKAGWRADLLARRRARGMQDVALARRRIAAHLLPLAAPGVTMCAYLPLATEPLDPDLPAALTAAGARVLLPVATADLPLDWCEWGQGTTRRGSFGIEEPVGPRLGSEAIESAQVVLVPALAVDRSGTRLGRGGGHYDRSLALLATPATGPGQPRLIAVVFDDEIVDSLPREPFDRPVTEIATPDGGLRRPG